MSNPNIKEDIEQVLLILKRTHALRSLTGSADAGKAGGIRERTRQKCEETIAPVIPETIQSLHELFATIQDPRLPKGSFHTRLDQLRNALRSELFPHEGVGEIDMSKYSAIAITHALRVIMGDKAGINTVFGHHEPFRITRGKGSTIMSKIGERYPEFKKRTRDQLNSPVTTSTPHYWTEITIQGVRYFCDATYGDLSYMQAERIIFAQEEELEEHNLYRQTIDGTITPEDVRILLSIQQNGGNSLIDFTRKETRNAYEQLVQCITMCTL
jgi:hypothetical protein